MADQGISPQRTPEDLVVGADMSSTTQDHDHSDIAIRTPLPVSRPSSVSSTLSRASESAQEMRPELGIPLPPSRSSTIGSSVSMSPEPTPKREEESVIPTPTQSENDPVASEVATRQPESQERLTTPNSAAHTLASNDQNPRDTGQLQESTNISQLSRLEWRPLALRFPFLLIFTLFTAVVLAAVEIMYHYSSTHSGLTAITDHDSGAKTFSWAYLPIIIALAIALGWVSIASEIARMTPWQLLSTSEGTSVDILFKKSLQNPFAAPLQFVRLLWKEKGNLGKLCYLAVFYSSFGHLISFLVLPPLQASLLSIKELNISIEAKYLQMSGFNSSNPVVNTDRLGEIFLRSWLAYQGLPIAKSAWITGVPGDMVAVLPIAPQDQQLQHVPFQASATAYWSNLNCTAVQPTSLVYIDPAYEIELAQNNMMPNKTQVNFSRLQHPISAIFSGLGVHGGCQFSVNVPLSTGNDPISSQVDEWYYGGMDFLSSSKTSANSSADTSCNQWMFLNVNYAVLKYVPSNSTRFDFDVTFEEEPTFNAVYCQPFYFEVPDLKVSFVDTNATSSFNYDPKELAAKSTKISSDIFNATQFEEYLFISFESAKPNDSYPSTLPNGQNSTIQTNFKPLSYYFSIISYANIQLWRNMDISSGVPEWARKYFLAAFLQRIDLSSTHWNTGSVNTLMLPISLREKRLIVNAAYARATEGILSLLLFLGIASMILQQKLTTNLRLNPNSVTVKCLLVHDRPDILSCVHTRNSKASSQGAEMCHLVISTEGFVKLELTSNANSQRDTSEGTNSKTGTHFITKKLYFQILLTAFSLIILIIVVSLWIVAKRRSGLPQSSFYINLDNVNQFAWTIIPVLCVIMIKFLWGFVDDHFRLLQPYISLAQRPASAKSSISLNYRSTMEGWVIIKAYLRKHYILAAITALSLLNEVLVVAMGAVFRSRPVTIIRPVKSFTNSTLRTAADVISFPDSSQIYGLTETYIPIWDFPMNTMNFFYPEVLTISTVAWGGESAPWTTVDYAFLPVIPSEADRFSSSPGNTNWTVSTLGVRGIAKCHALDTPPNLFEEVPVFNDANKTVQLGLEIHDWKDGPENTNNTVRYQQSVFRIPPSRTGVRARNIKQQGTLQGIMNYTAFWGPLWSVNIDSAGNISSMNISTLPSNLTILQGANSQQTIWNLPEMETGHFVAGFIDFSRVQDPETSIWYSKSPAAAFVACEPSFEYVNAQAILDGVSQRVLDYELQGMPVLINGSDYLKSWHDNDGNIPAQMGFGSAFTAASIFRTDRPVSDSFVEPYFLADQSSYVSSFHFDNLSQMIEPGNLERATEAAFSALFSQFAAVPSNVFIPIDTPVPATAGLMISETRILVSTTAMAIVVAILFIIVVALAALSYWTKLLKEPLHELERQSDTIASELFWVSRSANLLRLIGETEHMTKKERERHLNSGGGRFRIGKFIGVDRARYFGIEVVDGTEWEDGGVELAA